MDEDNDGIMNAMDDCPNTPAGTAVNTRGCKLAAASIKVDNVQFKTGTDVLNNESRQILDNVAQTLKQNPHLSFEIAGHTDSTGNYQANVNLSAKRANSVRQYLIDHGVAGNRLTARGYGPDKPVASNGSREGRAKNRRVELILK
jgi:OOP family OmpA-OmpF porin